MLEPIPSGSTAPTVPAAGNYSPQEHEAMQRAIVALLDKWNTKDADAVILLGGISTKTLQRWRDGEYGRVTRDLADRMSNLLGIHKALRIIFAEPKRGYAWVSKKIDAFDGVSALEIMKQGSMIDIVRVRRYLDSVRGGW